jgi:hydroxymethylglutaryl-CoA reductase
VDRIVSAYKFAFYDIYRATTNNKGVMNGIDPVVIATGNDWRAVEAGAHAWACRTGSYKPMATWSKDANGDLLGEIELPISVGTVGGVTKLHPTAKAAMKLLGSPTATELAQVICSVGLAQNLSALRALASEGIQRGHMSLHKRNLDLLGRKGAVSK